MSAKDRPLDIYEVLPLVNRGGRGLRRLTFLDKESGSSILYAIQPMSPADNFQAFQNGTVIFGKLTGQTFRGVQLVERSSIELVGSELRDVRKDDALAGLVLEEPMSWRLPPHHESVWRLLSPTHRARLEEERSKKYFELDLSFILESERHGNRIEIDSADFALRVLQNWTMMANNYDEWDYENKADFVHQFRHAAVSMALWDKTKKGIAPNFDTQKDIAALKKVLDRIAEEEIHLIRDLFGARRLDRLTIDELFAAVNTGAARVLLAMIEPTSAYHSLRSAIHQIQKELMGNWAQPSLGTEHLLMAPCAAEEGFLACEGNPGVSRRDPRVQQWCRGRGCTYGKEPPVYGWGIQNVFNSRVGVDTEKWLRQLASWVNRLIEIPQHLFCEGCSQPFFFDSDYSKYSTQYETTVFYCNTAGCSRFRGSSLKQGVYLNHCLACSDVIDSRDSEYRCCSGRFACASCRACCTEHGEHYWNAKKGIGLWEEFYRFQRKNDAYRPRWRDGFSDYIRAICSTAERDIHRSRVQRRVIF